MVFCSPEVEQILQTRLSTWPANTFTISPWKCVIEFIACTFISPQCLLGKWQGRLFPNLRSLHGFSMAINDHQSRPRFAHKIWFMEHCFVCEIMSLLNSCANTNHIRNLDFVADYKSSRMFKEASYDLLNVMATRNVTMNNHNWGIGPSSFKSTSLLLNYLH